MTPGTRPEPERRRPRAKGRWGLLFVPPALLGVTLLVLQSELVGQVAARALEKVLEEQLGEDVTIGRIVLDYLPLRAEVQGILITHRESGETIAAVRMIRAEPGLEGFLPVLRRVTIDAPQVSLHVDGDGLREFRNVASGGGGGSKMTELPWQELVVRDGSFRLETPDVTVQVDRIGVAPDEERTNRVLLGSLEVQAGSIDQEARDVDLRKVLLAPDRVVIPRLELAFDALALDGYASVVAGGPLAGDLSAHLDLGRLTWTGAANQTYAEGLVDADVSLGGTTGAPEVGGTFALDDLVIWRETDVPGLLPTRIGDVHGPWSLDLGPPLAVDVGPLDMVWGDGELGVTARVLPAEGTIGGTVTAERVHLAKILQSVSVVPAPWVDLEGDVEVHVDGTLSPLFLEGPFEVDVGQLLVNNGPYDDPHADRILTVPAVMVQGKVSISLDELVFDARVASRRSHGHARASIGLGEHGPLAIDVDFPALDLEEIRPLGDAELGGIAEVHGFLGGPWESLGANAELDVTSARVLGFPVADRLRAHLDSDLASLFFTDIQADLGASHYQGDFTLSLPDPMSIDTQLYIPSGRIHDLAGVFLDIGPADGALSGTIDLAGPLYHLEGDVALGLADVDLYGERFPSGHIAANMDDGELTVQSLALKREREGRTQSVLARGSVKRGWLMNVEVLGDGLSLATLDHLKDTGLPLQGDLQLDAQVGGTLFDPEPRGRITATRTYYDGTGLADTSISFRTTDGLLSWEGTLLGEAMRARGTLGLWGEQPYEAEAWLSGFPLHLFYPRGADGRRVEARITGDVSLAGRFGDQPTPVDIDGRFDEVFARWSGHTLRAPEPWVFAVHGTSVQISRLRLLGDDGTDVGFEGYATGQGRLAFRGGGTVNLDLARAFVPELQVAQGQAEVDIAIERDASGNPRVEMGARIDDATLRTGYFPADFEELSATIEASADRYVVRDLDAQVGGGTFHSGESVIEAEGWTPTRFELQGSFNDARVQYLDYLPPMVADADLRFDGPVDDLLLSGDIDIRDMEFRDRIDWESWVISLREERLTGSAPVEGERYFGMDLAVKADETVHLRNNVADAEAKADLRIVGDTSRPGMVGEVTVEPGGRVYLHEREFEVTRGEIRFVDPYTFDPDLDVLLETDVRSHEQDYHLNYGITGPFSDWRTTTSADPFLSQADVNALLLFGVTREELERYGGLGTALVAETGDLLLAQTAISRTNLLFDRWNLVSGVSERGSNTVTSDLRLVAEKQIEDFDFTLEKRLDVNLASDWYLSVERRLAEKLYATAYAATRQEGRSLPIGAAYGLEFKLKWELD